jgi:hypothetical protein
MLRRRFVPCFVGVLLLALLGAGRASAQVFPEIFTVQAQAPTAPVGPPGPKADGPKIDAANPGAANPEAPKFEPLTSAALGDTSFAAGAPSMIGDFGAILVRKTLLVPNFTTTTTTNTVMFFNPETKALVKTVTTTTTSQVPITVPITIYVPVAGRDGSGFKIADGATPVPTDRLFFTWNGFDDLRSRGGSSAGFFSSASSTTPPTRVMMGMDVFNASTTTNVQVATPVLAANPTGDLNREIFGFEKTFLGGNASIEVRAPIYEGSGDLGGNFNGTHFGDVTAVLKYALFLDPEGLVFSAGLATTAPTGQPVDLDTTSYRSWSFQPFVGYVYRFGDAYVQGFNSIVVSTASQDPTLLFNDIGFGYRFYKGNPGDYLRSIDAVLEGHLTTPLDHRGANSELIVTDIFSTTAGLHFGVGPRSFLTLGLNGTLTGPRPYGVEGIVNFDYRF